MSFQQLVDATPKWVNWTIIMGSAALSWIQAIAGVVAIVWGSLQVYSWIRNELRARKEK